LSTPTDTISRETISRVVKLLKSTDFGKADDTELAKLEKAYDILAAKNINSEDLNEALKIFLTDPEASRRYIHGPSYRGTNRGLLNDLLRLDVPYVAFRGGIYRRLL
jgi:hypothetical protein